jgi:hypothetical protein
MAVAPDPVVEQAITGVVAMFEHLSLTDLPNMGRYYAVEAHFKDPFNEVQGLDAIQGIFVHMFESLHEPRFVVTTRVVQGQQCFLTWDFLFRFKSFQQDTSQTVRGASHLVLNAQGLITLHRDYWDAAEELYEKFPVVGGLMRWLKKRANS